MPCVGLKSVDKAETPRFEIYYSCPLMTQLPLVADDLCARELLRQGRAVVVDYDSEFQGADLQARPLCRPLGAKLAPRHVTCWRPTSICTAWPLKQGQCHLRAAVTLSSKAAWGDASKV